jgi:hypothetical protein
MDVVGLLRNRQRAELGPAQRERFGNLTPHTEVPAGQVSVVGHASELEDGELVGQHLPRRDPIGELRRHVALLPRKYHGLSVRGWETAVKPDRRRGPP